MSTKTQDNRLKTLEEYFDLQYPIKAVPDPDGGYFVEVPDLPGCMTQVDTIDEIIPMIEDARRAWIETAYELGREIPLPSYPEEYSGKFNLRLPKSLHRRLAESAERERVSLNTYVTGVLTQADALSRVLHKMYSLESHLGEVTFQLTEIGESIRYRPTGVPSARRDRFQVMQVAYKDSVAA